MNRVFQDLCIEAIREFRHVFVATVTGRPKSWQGNAVFQTLLQKTLLFLCGSFEPGAGDPGTSGTLEVLITTRKADLLAAEVLRLGEITDAEAKQLLGLEGIGQRPKSIPQISSSIIKYLWPSIYCASIYISWWSFYSPFDRQPNS